MIKSITINDRGTLTLPKELRRRLGLQGKGQVVVEETENGVFLRAGATFPIEMYTEKRIAEFSGNNEKALDRYRLKIKK